MREPAPRRAPAERRTITTACPRNCYSTCTMRVEVEGQRVVGLAAHPGNKATPEGLCLKGLSYVERVSSPDRLLQPLERRKAKGPAAFRPVTWDHALGRIAEKLVQLRSGPGPQSILYYAASGTKGLLGSVGLAFWRIFGGCTTTYGDLCWPAGLEATRLTLGANKHNAPWDLPNARLIILWGKNPAETNIHQIPFIDAALERGARLIVIDPRRTPSADRASLLIRPRPGTDGALALGTAHLLIERGAVDRAFVEQHLLGYEPFAALAGEYPPGRVAKLCEIPEQAVERLADAIAGRPPVTICAGYGMQRYTNSGQTMRAIIALLALTGNIGRSGAGWQFANLQSAIFGPLEDPQAFYPPERPDGPVRVSVSTARLGRDMLAQRDPPLRMAWVERGNPIPQNPETPTVLRAFRSLDLRVVVDQFLTDTAREADIVLPAKTLFEQTDIIGAYWHPYIQLKQKAIDPPGQVKPETEIYRLLAEHLDLPANEVEAHIPGSSDDTDEAAVKAYLERRLTPFEGLTLERLREGPILAPGHEEIAFADGVFSTPSGRIELVSREAADRWGLDPLPRYSEPVESARRAPRGTRRFPLHLLTPNTKNRIHSQFNNLSMIRAVSPGPELLMHPADAGARGLAEGERARLFNARGSLTLAVRFDQGIKPGVVVVTNGWWLSDGGAVNVCSQGRETDMGHGAAFHDNLVEVERER